MELKILQIDDKCTGCGACVSTCPKHCLTLSPNKDGFYYPHYDPTDCINCTLCEKVCHIVNPIDTKVVTKENFYMYSSGDLETRRLSSSGGAFSLFAEKIIEDGGIVFGSTYNGEKERLEVSDSINNDWRCFRKSKYIESYMGDCYRRIADLLKNNKKVFYCGTPCQIRGLKHYLNARNISEIDLLTADFICHGVPSNLCFTEYKKQFESRNKHVSSVDFRYKDFTKHKLAWHNMVLKLSFDNGSSKIIPYQAPHYYGYYKLFMDNIILRKCCYECHYPIVSVADITFADFWGISKYLPQTDDNTGISIVKIHSDKAKEMWSRLLEDANMLPYSAVEYLYHTPNKAAIIAKRDCFFLNMHKKGYDKATREFYQKELIAFYTFGWVKQIAKKVLRKK